MTYFVEGMSEHNGPDVKVSRIGEFDALPDAISSAKRIVDEFLCRSYVVGMEPQVLFARYLEQGVHPFIFRDDDTTFNVPGFNHLAYARIRCNDICNGDK